MHPAVQGMSTRWRADFRIGRVVIEYYGLADRCHLLELPEKSTRRIREYVERVRKKHEYYQRSRPDSSVEIFRDDARDSTRLRVLIEQVGRFTKDRRQRTLET